MSKRSDAVARYKKELGICEDCGDRQDWHREDGACEICDKIGGKCKNKEALDEALPGGTLCAGTNG